MATDWQSNGPPAVEASFDDLQDSNDQIRFLQLAEASFQAEQLLVDTITGMIGRVVLF